MMLFAHSTWAQTQSIIVQTGLTPSQLDPNQLAKFNRLSASSLHDNFQLVQVQNLSTSQVNSKVRLALSNLTCNDLIFTAIKVEYTSESEYYWYGIIDSQDVDNSCKGGSITLMARNGEKFGTIVFDDYSYEFQELGNGIQAFSRFKLEAIDEHECGVNDSTQGYRSSSQLQANPSPKNESSSANRITGCSPTDEVRVLVLWTQAAENIEANINNRIALAIAQTNQAYQNSQVGGTLKLVLAASQKINFTETFGSQDKDLIAANATAQNLRNIHKADIVVLLTNGSNYGQLYGIVTAIGPIFNSAYAIVQTNAATGGRYTFAHEVGHLFGARHDNDPTGTIEHGYFFTTGFIFTKKHYTLLANMPAGKSREQNYSNPDVQIKRKPTGTSGYNNNAQQHRNTAAIVADFFPDFLITGNPSFCTSGVYSIDNLPAGSTVTWSAVPAIVNFQPNPGNPTTATAAGNGTFTLTANIVSSCGNATVSRQITVGSPSITITSTHDSYCSGTYQTWSLSAEPTSSGSNWQWTVDYLSQGSDIFIFNPNSPFTYVDVSGGGTVRLTYTDLCGVTRTDGVTVYSNCYVGGFAYSLSPNPTSGSLQVSSTDKKTNIKEIKVTDKTGAIKKHFIYSQNINSVIIDISSLPPDIYYVQIYDGKKWASKPISKK